MLKRSDAAKHQRGVEVAKTTKKEEKEKKMKKKFTGLPGDCMMETIEFYEMSIVSTVAGIIARPSGTI